MNVKSTSVCTALALALASAACSHSATAPTQSVSSSNTTTTSSASSATQSSGGGTLTTNGVTITTPVLISPTDGQKFKYSDQPLTLTVKDAVATGGGSVTYTFQVASDAGFASVVQTKDGVTETSGQTSVKLDSLAGQNTYYWRARANSNGTPGLFSKGRSFNVGPQVVIQAPVPASPANGASSSGTPPSFTVNNAARTGPVGAITYLFQISDSSAFTNILGTATVGEQDTQTTASINVNLTTNGTYYWRAQATDPSSGVSSPFSTVFSFKYVPFDMHQAIIMNSPYDLADWAQTANITSIVFTPDAFLVDFDKRDGPDRWPDTPFGSGSIEYTLGMCLNLNAQWYCSAVVQFWYGRDLAASTPPWNVATAWFYDPARWGPMAGHQPQDGEIVGIFVCAGNCRNNTAGDQSYVKERSNVALIPWTNEADESFTFSAGKILRAIMKHRR